MLIEAEMRDLAKNKEYTKVFNYFHDEYTEMLKNFLQRNDVKINDDDCLIDYIVKTRFLCQNIIHIQFLFQMRCIMNNFQKK